MSTSCLVENRWTKNNNPCCTRRVELEFIFHQIYVYDIVSGNSRTSCIPWGTYSRPRLGVLEQPRQQLSRTRSNSVFSRSMLMFMGRPLQLHESEWSAPAHPLCRSGQGLVSMLRHGSTCTLCRCWWKCKCSDHTLQLYTVCVCSTEDVSLGRNSFHTEDLNCVLDWCCATPNTLHQSEYSTSTPCGRGVFGLVWSIR